MAGRTRRRRILQLRVRKIWAAAAAARGTEFTCLARSRHRWTKAYAASILAWPCRAFLRENRSIQGLDYTGAINGGKSHDPRRRAPAGDHRGSGAPDRL